MRILRIATSSDTWPGTPEELRTPALLARRLEAATGEAVEWDLHTIWPSLSGSEKLRSWIDEFNPEIVALHVSPFWYALASPALRVSRRGGPPGRLAAQVVIKAAKKRRVASSAPFRLVRHVTTKATAPAYHFEPEQIVERVDEWLRLVLRYEVIVPVVFGPTLTAHHDSDPGRLATMRLRMVSCNEQLRESCRRLSVAVDARSTPEPSVPRGKAMLAADGFHPNERSHAYEAEVEFPYLLEAWRTVREARAARVEVAGL